jgi:2-polyprenyl-3-methyl-5-hydroxy-6-metoxy-1,4-benzoquinol methylase
MTSDVIEGVSYSRGELQGCLLCGKLHPPRIIPVKFGMTAMIAECPECRIAYQTPRPALEASLAYMEMRWRSHDDYVANTAAQRARAEKQLALVGKIAATGRRLLDFGAGTGAFVRVARENGWDATGVDRSRVAVERAFRENGVELSLELSETENRLDFVTLWDVIEHLRDPVGTVQSLRSRLRPGGWMFFETGNWESWNRLAAGDAWGLYLFDHQYYFSPHSLARVLDKAGLVNFQLLPAGKGIGSPSPASRDDLNATRESPASAPWPQHGAIDIMVAAAQNPCPST